MGAGTVGLIVGSWLLLAAAQAGGAAAALHHHALIEGGPPLWLALPAFLVAWQVMVAAMMLPASLAARRGVEHSVPIMPGERRGFAPGFVASLGLVWAGFGLAAFLGDDLLHHVVDATPWLAGHPYLIQAGVLAVAGAWQLTPAKRRFLEACREPAVFARSRRTHDDPGADLRHAFACLGSSWALMLLMFGEGFTNLGWMAALTVLMAAEMSSIHGRHVAWLSGVVLLVGSIAVVAG